MENNSSCNNDNIPCSDSEMEMARRGAADDKFAQSKYFIDWLLQSENHLLLYKECTFYREAILRNELALKPDIDSEWRSFNGKMHHNDRIKSKRKIWIYSSAAAAILIVAWLFPLNNKFKQVVGHQQEKSIISQSGRKAMTTKDNKTTGIKVSAKSVSANIWQKAGKMNKETFPVANKSLNYQAMIDSRQASVEEQTLNISRGKSYHLVLDDGTQVWVNADTKITYPLHFGSDKRVIELEGEAYFKVAKDKDRPFIVETPYLTTVDLGTEFDIKAYQKEDASVTLIEGKVAVSNIENENRTVLIPGENASLTNGGFVVKSVDVKNYISWINGYFYFDNASLQDIMKELSRWYNVNVIFKDTELKKLKFKFWADRNDSFEEAVSMINQMGKVAINTVNPHEVIITQPEK